MILVDLERRYKNIEKSVSEGVFNIDFIKGKHLAYIGTNQGLFFNLANGTMKPVGSEFDPTDDNNFETCKKKISWGFNKYL
ncbi:hypothetical protein [Pantoea ananatis]|uniref:hypothetical protein n=1 Tax=Pantoea ananas TaxID=553 RepID=UPI00352A1F2C